MQLDQTHVVIRARTASEIGDLSLVMLRRFPSVIFVGFVLGALPWVLINAVLLWRIPYYELDYGFDDPQASIELWRYIMWSITLVFAQAPLAGVLSTIFLGQAVFEKEPTWKSVFSDARSLFLRCTWMLGGVRLAIPSVILITLTQWQPANGFVDVFIPLVVLFWLAIVRAGRPFLPRNPVA